MQRELNDVEYAIRTFIDVEVSREQKQNKKIPKLGNLKDILMFELSGGGKRKKKSALPDNQTWSVDGINIAANEGSIPGGIERSSFNLTPKNALMTSILARRNK